MPKIDFIGTDETSKRADMELLHKVAKHRSKDI
jgi:hypothetical protein